MRIKRELTVQRGVVSAPQISYGQVGDVPNGRGNRAPTNNIGLSERALTSSSSAISSAESLQPSAPAFSSACRAFFAPGIGMAPLQMTQFNAT